MKTNKINSGPAPTCDTVSYFSYSPLTTPQYTAGLIKCYKRVFAEPPWNEWKRCPRCSKNFGLCDTNALRASGYRCCETPVVDYWPSRTVEEDLRREIGPETSCWLAVSEGKVIGFAYSYPIETKKLSEKLGIELQRPSRMSSIPAWVNYIDDIGVLPEFQRRGIAKELFGRNVLDLSNAPASRTSVFLARTRQLPQPSNMLPWFVDRLGFKIVAQYIESDGRVILGRRGDGLQQLLSAGYNTRENAGIGRGC